ncbi:MAG: peptidase M20, partial [Thermoanaerobaculia bacterium]
MPETFDSQLAAQRLTQAWDEDITRQISDYIAIPAKSPAFAADWRELGHIETVVRRAASWAQA